MPEVAFVMSDGQRFPLRELAATLGFELEQQGVPCTITLGGFPEARPGLVHILLDPRGYVAFEGEQALPSDAILRRTVFLCAEPPPTDGEKEHIALLRRAGAVFATEQRSVLALHRLGIPANLIRPGYSKYLDRFDATAERPIDVMFLGEHTLRRTGYLRGGAGVLARHNCLLQISEGIPTAGDTSSSLAQGRWPLLAQTKVLISLHGDEESRQFDWRGALDAIHAGAVVVAEHSSAIAPLVPGEHLLVASADALPFVVEGLVSDEQRLARLRSQAYDRLRTWIPYALPVAVLRAALVELVGEPEAPDADLGKLRPRSAVADRVASDAGSNGAPRVETLSQSPSGIEVACESPTWASRRAPRVTAVVALGGHDERLAATLDSLARSRMRDFELVIVAGSEGGQSRRAAEDWVSSHPGIASCLVAGDVGGLGAARNVSLDFARGPLLLVLDPGQELYPRCLDVLAGKLEAMPEMAFLYTIQEVIGDPIGFVGAGGDHLLSFLGWDPERLRATNYIHTPALIRTDRLRQLGGFATDWRLVGFEDYDLWCRIADQEWRGQLTPQVLTRRSESGSSRTLSSIHPSRGDATNALVERAPTLMAGAFGVPAPHLS
jgi:Glycosyl transferase family 2